MCSTKVRLTQLSMVFENRIPLRIFEPKKEEGTSASVKLHNDELSNLCYQNISLRRSSKDFVIDGLCVSYWA